METFDYIIAGGGAAGLSLAYQLVHSSLRERRILLIDREQKRSNDRTWCFWTRRPTFFNSIYFRSWQKVAIQSEEIFKAFDLGEYRYNMLRGIDFYNFVLQELANRPNIKLLTADIQQVRDTPDGVVVTAGGKSYSAGWAFDSRFDPNGFSPDPLRYHHLKQHFRGWEVETGADVFDSAAPTLFDFRTEQESGLRFFYILPFSPRSALVEYTIFSDELLKPEVYEQKLANFLSQTLKIEHYTIIARESGAIPMTDYPFPRKLGEHVLAIGTLGGMVKPSTGYAFLRIQHDSAAIIRSLEQHGNPFEIKTNKARYRWFDSIILNILLQKGHLAKAIFIRMFTRNTIQRVFEFLDENATLAENIRFMATFKPLPFIRAMVRVKFLHRI
jgi:lycopene beta-cyclase